MARVVTKLSLYFGPLNMKRKCSRLFQKHPV